MPHKVSPIGYRIQMAPSTAWLSRWFTTDPRKYSQYLQADTKLRKGIMAKLKSAGCARVEIERSVRSVKVTVYVTRPGIVIGRGGTGIEELKKFVITNLGLTDKNSSKVDLQIEEIKQPDINAYLVATRVAEQLEKRMSSRRVAVKTLERTMAAGAKGIKIVLAGRINGAEIARREPYMASNGTVPFSTLRADVDYAQVPALTRSGYVGVKVWIYKGEKA